MRIIASVSTFASAYFIGEIIDSFIEGTTATTLLLLTSAIAGVGILSSVLRAYSKLGLHNIAARVRMKLRKQSITQLFNLSLQCTRINQLAKR